MPWSTVPTCTRSSVWRAERGKLSKVKEFAYFGFAITLVSASIAHLGRGDASLSVLFVIDPLVFLGLLTVSYVYFEKSHSPGAAAESSNHSPSSAK